MYLYVFKYNFILFILYFLSFVLKNYKTKKYVQFLFQMYFFSIAIIILFLHICCFFCVNTKYFSIFFTILHVIFIFMNYHVPFISELKYFRSENHASF